MTPTPNPTDEMLREIRATDGAILFEDRLGSTVVVYLGEQLSTASGAFRFREASTDLAVEEAYFFWKLYKLEQALK